VEQLLVDYIAGDCFCLQNFPVQMIQLGHALYFAQQVEKAMKSKQMSSLKKQMFRN
jgi:hypothetical protein